jgi:hypothetical protein
MVVFQLVGLSKPAIGILSDQFLVEISRFPHANLPIVQPLQIQSGSAAHVQ